MGIARQSIEDLKKRSKISDFILATTSGKLRGTKGIELMEETNRELFEKVVKVAQARGFVFNASSIYGGLRSSYDYGPCLIFCFQSF